MTGTSLLDSIRSLASDKCLGRDAQKAFLYDAFRNGESPLVYVLGPGGIGKTTLIAWLASRVAKEGAAIVWISGEQIAPNTEAFLNGMRVTGRPDQRDLAEVGRNRQRDLVVIDSFEKLRPIQDWILGDFLSMIGSNVMVVLVGRERLSIRQRSERGLHDALSELELGPLPDSSARELLLRSGVPIDQVEPLIAIAHGFPLALRLLAARRQPAATLSNSAEILDALVESFVSNAPTAQHREALYASTLTLTIHEPLLDVMLGSPGNTAEIFAWLSQSAIMERTELGVSPHALVREVLFTDVQRRNPMLLERMQSRLVDAHVRNMLHVDIAEGHELLLQAQYARRNSPQVKQHAAFELAQRVEIVPLRPGNVEMVRSVIAKFEGAAGLASFDYWYGKRPLGQITMGSDGNVRSFQVIIRLGRSPHPEDLSDPLIAACHRAWLSNDPRPDSGDLFMFRWFMQSESYQAFSPALTHLMTLGPLVTLPLEEVDHIAFCSSPPEQWEPLAPAFHLRWHGTTVAFAGRTYGFSFGSESAMMAPYLETDSPRLNTLRAIVYKMTGLTPPPAPLSLQAPSSSLSRDEFARTLRHVLAHLHEPQQLRDPSLQPLVPQTAGVSAEEYIRDFITEGIARLGEAAGTSRFAEILEATYLRPSAKQHAAAMDLGLPYGTYRYQLRKALSLLEEELWHRLRARTN